MKTAWCAVITLAFAAAGASAAMAPRGSSPASCGWDHPGLDPYYGDVVQAIDRYTDIAPPVRERLKSRMEKRQYDDVVTIRRDAIEGQGSYEPTIRDMHFGSRSVCKTVTRDKWTSSMQERGLVYCESGECILVPTVCRNVSRITRNSPGGTGDPDQALAFAPPGAGPNDSPSFADGAGVPGGGGSPSGNAPLSAGPGTTGDPTAAAPTSAGPGTGGGGPGGGGPGFSSNPGPFGPNTPSTGPLLPPRPSTPAVPLPVPEPAGWALGVASVLALLLARRVTAGRARPNG
jgi:hypothetical protein